MRAALIILTCLGLSGCFGALGSSIPQPRHEILQIRADNKEAALAKARDVASVFHHSFITGFVYGTGSMMPFLDEGCVLVRQMVPFVDLEHGEIPLGHYMHRIVGGNPSDGFQTEGDNNRSVDPVALTANNYQGTVVVAVIRFADIPYHAPMSLENWLKRIAKP